MAESRPAPSQPLSKKLAHQTDIRSKLKTELAATDNLRRRTRNVVSFASPPLLSGLLESIKQVLGPYPKPTPIQSLSIEHFLGSGSGAGRRSGSETLLASETGSGKSIAYLLPVLQSLKESETGGSNARSMIPTVTRTNDEEAKSDPNVDSSEFGLPQIVPGPRAIILCPTHELCRQIATYAKSLSHNIKLRVVCASNPNKGAKGDVWNEEASGFQKSNPDSPFGLGRQVDLLISTPSKILSLVGGVELADRTVLGASQRSWGERERGECVGKVESRMSLANVEWLVVDETDVMFDRDFVRTTEAILEDIFEDRSAKTQVAIQDAPQSFNLVLSSATIPVALSNYLEKHHPNMVRLASPRIHRLPKNLETEYVQLTDGNKMSTIHKKIEAVWAEDAMARARDQVGDAAKSKIVIFCNEIRSARKLEEYLEGKQVDSLVMVGNDDGRLKGSNNHLSGFLNPVAMGSGAKTPVQNGEAPRVLITTSLLSRGLDFDPSIRHVFIVDEPRSAVDFIHRAGRTGRAGNIGTVVLFEKGSRRERRTAGKTSAPTPERFGKVPRRW